MEEGPPATVVSREGPPNRAVYNNITAPTPSRLTHSPDDPGPIIPQPTVLPTAHDGACPPTQGSVPTPALRQSPPKPDVTLHRQPAAAPSPATPVGGSRQVQDGRPVKEPTQQPLHHSPALPDPHTNRGPQVNITTAIKPHDIDFSLVAHWCAEDKPTLDNISPAHLQEYRKANWPDMSDQVHPATRHIYQAVKATGLSNCMQARIPVHNDINIPAWRARADGSPEDVELIDFIQFGFPLGYHGPTAHTPDPINHASALNFPQHVDEFIQQELKHGALIGPFDHHVFNQWQHVSPMMTRPKSDPQKRRIITDLSYPPDNSINAYIKKNCSMGKNYHHSLPTVTAVVDEIKRVGPGASLFTIDVHRAYKNFRACPLDWPLLNITWQNQDGVPQSYLDTAMPFGAKLSSLHFQRIANFITKVLAKEGVKAYMYLDDLIVIAPDPITAYYQFDTVKALFKDLGLPEVPGKTQPPSH